MKKILIAAMIFALTAPVAAMDSNHEAKELTPADTYDFWLMEEADELGKQFDERYVAV